MRGRAVVRPWGGPVSVRLDPRSVVVFVLLGLAAFAGVVANVGVGEYPIAPLDVIRALFGIESGDGNYDFIVNVLRLPRALVAVLVGAALAVSGAVLQGLTRNDLAAPDIIGVNAGAGLAAVTLIVAFPSVSAVFLPPAAFGGALVVAVLLYLLAWRGSSSPTRLVLIGVGLSAVATALTTFMITFGDIYQVSQALVWLTGSVYGRSWELGLLLQVLPYVSVGLLLAFALSRQITALTLGEDVATGLGQRTAWVKFFSVVAVVLLAGSAVAIAGPIGFVGLVVPHVARFFVGVDYRWILPYSALLGAVLLVSADIAARLVLRPQELPVGIMTALVGAPFFIYLARKRIKG